MDLLNCILKEPVSNIVLDCNSIVERELFDDKIGILDIRAKLNNSIDCNIEMQVVDKKNVEKRILYYLSRMYSKGIKKGKDYVEANKCIAILFTDFEIKNLENIKKYITRWNFREEEYKDIILTDVMEIYIIELPKVQKYSVNDKLDTWVNFIIKLGDIDMSKADEPIKKAKEVLEEISMDEHERYLADLREKYILDQNALELTGFERAKTEIAKKLKEKNIDIEIIIETTGLTKEEIENL